MLAQEGPDRMSSSSPSSASSIAAPTGPAPQPAAARLEAFGRARRAGAERPPGAGAARRRRLRPLDRRADRADRALARRGRPPRGRGLRPNAPCWRRKAAGRMSSSSRPAGLVDRRADRARATAVRREVEAFV